MTPRPTRSVRTNSLTPCIAAALAFAGLSFLPSAHADILAPGFTSAGAGPTQWTLNGNAEALAAGRPAIVNNELLLTGPANSNASSAWYNTAQGLSNFTASFTYNFLSGTAPTPADGFAFVLQNDGLSALGGGGGALGYLGGNLGNSAGDKSVALAFDLWNNQAVPTRSGFSATGYGDFSYSDTTPVNLRSTTPVNVNIAYRDGVFTETLTQGAGTTITKTFNVNVANRVGPTGFVGFTGGTGGANADQKITNFSLTLGNAPAVAAAAQPLSGFPLGGPGLFGIREVQSTAALNNIADAEAAIQNATLIKADYTAPVVNLYDSDVGGKFGGDSRYKLDPDQANPNNDTVNNVAVIATGTIRIPTAGMYTFGSSSDDGFRITIAGQRFERAFGDAGTTINANGALEFPNGRGSGGFSIGTIYLPAGDHQIQMLNWEGTGGASVELYASQGTKTAFDPATFNLVGNQAIVGSTGRNKVTTVGTWTYEPYTNASNVDQVLDKHFNRNNSPAILGPTAQVATINFHDPEGSNTGGHTPVAVFPANTAGDDNNFGGFASTTLTIDGASAGMYTFVMYTDDDSRFRILLGGVPVPLSSISGNGVTGYDSDGVNGNDMFGTGGCCNDLFGKYNLAAGTYTIEAAFHEGGGGAGFFLYGTQGDRNTFDPAAFQLLGANVDNGTWNTNVPAGIQLVPEPASITLLGVAVAGLASRRRRQQA